ncbi:sortase (surface protein transpeptidase) [Actinokineospora baliensis]|uniref:class E sortase n=1 Tax=Actinokineospora baliensis TaxID=547056 RepID=UPI0027DB8A24|nr:class E sortase [Actinokineospora baliensis]MBM7772282.1 sortase (surface protein transpeptidase) [Actinokineospora baliensis]
MRGSAPNRPPVPPGRSPGADRQRGRGSTNETPVNGRPGPKPSATGRPGPNGRPLPPRRPHPADAPTELLHPVRPDEEPTEFIRAHRGTLGTPRYRDPETERIVPPPDEPPDEPDDVDDEFDDTPEPPKRKASTGSVIVRSIGEAMVTLGVVVLLFVVYEVWVTDLMSAEKQADVTVALDEQWQQPTVADPQRQQKFEFADGEGMAKLYIPALGEDYHFTVVEGTSIEDLETGPGHYKKSALPGQPGNFAVAGHRVGKGAPFNDLDLLNACDAMVVETQSSWFVYRMLPTTDDAKNWAAKSANPRCAGVAPQSGEYARAVGRQIVTPAQSEVVAPVPGNPGAKTPAEQRQKMITLTTCHPKFSNRQRMILHGVLVREQPKNAADPASVPAELRETG